MITATSSMKIQLTALPNEVQRAVFSNLTFKERLRCSTVCKSWRLLILNWPEMWKSLSTDDGHNIVPDLLPYKNYIQGHDVTYFRYSSREFGVRRLSAVIDFVVERECTSIEDVKFSLITIDRTNFLKLSAICGKSLTRVVLDIGLRHSPDVISPDQILLNCPNLRKLFFSVPRSETWPPALSSADFQHQSLVDLALSPTNKEGTFDPLPYLILAPNLQRLSLQYSDISQNVASLPLFLRKHCPALASLSIKEPRHGGIWEAKDQDWETQPTSGLKEFALREPDECEPAVDLYRQIIAESHENLEVLELQLGDLFAEENYGSISRYPLPSLKHLRISGNANIDRTEILCNFLEHLVPKNLVSLKLWLEAELDGKALLRTIALNFEGLECLKFNSFDTGGLDHFFDVLHGKSLRKISLRFLRGLNGKALSVIATKYPALDDLTIHDCGDLSTNEFRTFLMCWKSNHRSKMNKLHLGISNSHKLRHHDSSSEIVMHFLDSMDKAAKKWILFAEFPQVWNEFPYNRQCGTIDHVMYRKYCSLSVLQS